MLSVKCRVLNVGVLEIGFGAYVEELGVRVGSSGMGQECELRAKGWVFRISCFGIRVLGFGFLFQNYDLGFGVQGAGFGV